LVLAVLVLLLLMDLLILEVFLDSMELLRKVEVVVGLAARPHRRQLCQAALVEGLALIIMVVLLGTRFKVILEGLLPSREHLVAAGEQVLLEEML
jgi:hypothetical protein